jgi:hypothetical protein
MSDAAEENILESLDTLGKLAGLIKITIGGAVAIGATLLGGLQRVEDQNAAIMETLRKIDSKLP